MRLAELQQAFQARVLHGARSIEAVVPGTESFDTTTRLGVYEYAYVARLVEALADTYSALHSALGEREFAELIKAYAVRSPPSHFSIRYFGHDLDAFILNRFSGIKAKALSELAAWEWKLADAFDAADTIALTRDSLSRIAPEQWGQVRFRLASSFHRMCLHTNAVQWWRAASENARRPTRWRATKPVEWVIWRSNLTTYFRSLKSDQAWAIDSVAAGQSFAHLCDGLARFCSDAAAPTRAATLLHQWLNDGWLVDIELASAA